MSLIFDPPGVGPNPPPSDQSSYSAKLPPALAPSFSNAHTSKRRSPLRASNITLVPGRIRESNQYTDYIELCKHILQIFSTAGRTVASGWSKETWTTLIRILLGVSDYLLSRYPPNQAESTHMFGKNGNSEHSPDMAPNERVSKKIDSVRLSRVGEELCESLIRLIPHRYWASYLRILTPYPVSVIPSPLSRQRLSTPSSTHQNLYELWLRSEIMDEESWDIIENAFQRWSHHLGIILEWNAVSLGLTNRMLRIMYSDCPYIGSSRVNIAFKGYQVKLDLPSEFTHYAWLKVLYHVRQPERLPPTSLNQLMVGVGRMVTLILSVGNLPRPALSPGSESHELYYPPPMAVIMDMVSPWLFAAARAGLIPPHHSPSASASMYAGARAKAYETLLKIFTTPQVDKGRPAERDLLAFYRLIRDGLGADECLQAIILHGQTLFLSDLEGIRMLIPEFLAAVKRVLPHLAPDFKLQVHVAESELRLAAFRMVGDLLSMPDYLGSLPLCPTTEPEPPSPKSGSAGPAAGCPGNLLPNGLGRLFLPGSARSGGAQPGPSGGRDSAAQFINCALAGGRSLGQLSREEQCELTVRWVREVYASPLENRGTTFSALKLKIGEIMMTTIVYESTAHNYEYMLRFLLLFILVDLKQYPEILEVASNLVRMSILEAHVPPEVLLNSLNFLVKLADLIPFTDTSGDWVSSTLLSLCDILERMTDASEISWNSLQLVVRTSVRLQPLDYLRIIAADTLTKLVNHITRSVIEIEPNVIELEWDDVGLIRENLAATFGDGSSSLWTPKVLDHSSAIGGAPPPPAPRPSLLPSGIPVVMASTDHRSEPPSPGSVDPELLSPTGSPETTPLMETDANPVDPVPQDNPHAMNQPHVQFFYIDHNVICIMQNIFNPEERPNQAIKGINHPRKSFGPSVIIAVRFPSGKLSWRLINAGDIPLRPEEGSGETDESNPPSPSTVSDGASPGKPPAGMSTRATPRASSYTSMDYSFDQTKEPVAALLGIRRCTAMRPSAPLRVGVTSTQQDLLASIRTILEANPPDPQHYATHIYQVPEIKPSHRQIDPDFVRIALSEMGYLSFQPEPSLTPLRLTQSLLSDIEALDTITERVLVSASVLYTRTEDLAWLDSISPRSPVSPEFVRFWETLGWCVELPTYRGFKGTLASSNLQQAMVYSDTQTEIMYYIPQLTVWCSLEASESVVGPHCPLPQPPPPPPPPPSAPSGQPAASPLEESGASSLESASNFYALFDQAVRRDVVSILWVDEPLVHSPRDLVTRLLNQHHGYYLEMKSYWASAGSGSANPVTTPTSSEPGLFPWDSAMLQGIAHPSHHRHTRQSNSRGSGSFAAAPFMPWLPMMFYLIVNPIPRTNGQLVRMTAVIVNPDQTNPQMQRSGVSCGTAIGILPWPDESPFKISAVFIASNPIPCQRTLY
ncbi:hypothetical protein BJ085DRAFT_30333 [Dimargaris cristalligena]|uniref:Ral GTPase-activating protein subunit alpha/beta N-terminal domain-containing protein n=1 Tax=Dimargaris cristalligena TaxID=215637 RepID=A0A4Q0A2C1_9FUNG|nr:hypothetical protein BJ085DRAFT_30333 [Dimargaris cristalligena]|eukprot:RKP40207.1 hypothetical protein BJ085DRAFT_30333 [Dimargaris cristalligena]